MSAINQCTRCITGETRLPQYYRLCLTCSAVGVCLNCAGICHENHTLGPLLREPFYCQCQQITHTCRALRLISEPLLLEGSNGETNPSMTKSKKRKHSDLKPEKIYLWTKHNQIAKSFHSLSYQTREDANQNMKLLFIQKNPWQWSETDLYAYPTFTMNYDENDLLRIKIIDEGSRESWEVGAEIIEGSAPFLSNDSAQTSHNSLPSTKKAKNNASTIPESNNGQYLSPERSATKGIALSQSKTTLNGDKQSPTSLTDDDDEDMVLFTDIKPKYELANATADKNSGKKKNTRGKKDPGAPKGPVASYLMYSMSQREKVVADNPGMSVIDISRTIGQQWKAMSLEEKQPYEELARLDKERYYREMEEFKIRKSSGDYEPPPPKVRSKPGPKPKKDRPVMTTPATSAIEKETEMEVDASEIDPNGESEDHSLQSEDVHHDGDSGKEEEIVEEEEEPQPPEADNSNKKKKRYMIYSSYCEQDDEEAGSAYRFEKYLFDLSEAQRVARDIFLRADRLPIDVTSNEIKQEMQETIEDDGLMTLTFKPSEGGVWKVVMELES